MLPMIFGEKRIDSQAAVSIDAMKDIIDYTTAAAYLASGSESFKYSEAELNYGNTGPMKKAIVARVKINRGDAITKKNIAFKRTEVSSPLLQKDIMKIIGTTATKDIEVDEIIGYDKVEYEFKKENFDQFFISKNKYDEIESITSQHALNLHASHLNFLKDLNGYSIIEQVINRRKNNQRGR